MAGYLGQPQQVGNTSSDGTGTGTALLTATAANIASQNGSGASVGTIPGQWSVNNQATAGTPSVSKAAGAAGVRHVCTGVSLSVACNATPQTPVIVNLRDGATGAGTILRTWALSAIAGTCAHLEESDLNIVGTGATAMTLEFASANAANVIGSVNLAGYDLLT